jgi:hypothetical protein
MHLIDDLAQSSVPAQVFVTGGGSHFLDGCNVLGLPEPQTVPTLTLEGIRIAAEALP